MKKTRKILALLLAAVMVFAMSVSAFAATTETTEANVTIVLKYRDEYGQTDALNIPVKNTNTFVIDLNKLPGHTVYDVVNALPQLVQVAEDPANPGTPANCTWKTVNLVDSNWQPTGQTAKALNSLAFKNEGNIVSEENVYTSKVLESTANSYKGWDWTYTVGADSPVDYMDQHTVVAGDVITLTYGYSSFSW